MLGRFLSGLRVDHRGCWLGLLDEVDLVHVTTQYYGRARRYTLEVHNTSGMLRWETEAVVRYFPLRGRVLVLGAGGGREVIALEQRGFEVEGYDCNPLLVAFGEELLESLGLRARLTLVAANEVPLVRTFDAALHATENRAGLTWEHPSSKFAAYPARPR